MNSIKLSKKTPYFALVDWEKEMFLCRKILKEHLRRIISFKKLIFNKLKSTTIYKTHKNGTQALKGVKQI